MTTAPLVRAAAGLSVPPDALPDHLEEALALAHELGAPRGPVLAAAVAVAEERLALRTDVEVAAAEGRAVARGLLVAPPVLGPATAALVASDPWAVWSTPAGRVVAAVAALLWLVGVLVVRRLVRTALQTRADVVEEVLDLTAVAVAAGAGVPAALRLAGRTRPSAAADRLALWLELGGRGTPPAPWSGIAEDLADALRSGVGAPALLRGHARARRRSGHAAARRRAARLGPRLTVPTTLLLLPAAGLVVAAPLVHGLVTAL